MSSFKVACPSCEAQVLIKNPSLVGTKVECPKCKYRFKVEAPADAAGDAAKPAKGDKAKGEKKDKKGDTAADGDKKKKEKAGGKNNKKTLGIALGVGGVLLLLVGGYVMFGGDSNSNSTPSGGMPMGGGGSASTGGGDQGVGGKNPDDKKGKETPKTPSLKRSDVKEPTNLLPGETVAVYRFDVGRVRQTPIGGPLFDPVLGDLFRNSLGLDVGDVDQYFHCFVGDKVRAPFGMIRLKDPVPPKQITGRVVGIGAAKTVRERELHPVENNPFLKAVGNAFAARSLLADVYDRSAGAAAAGKETSFGVCVYDTQTVLLGDYDALETYLAGLNTNGYPAFQSELRKDPPRPVPKAKSPTDPMATPAADPGMPPPKKEEPKKEEPAGPDKDYSTNPTYLSVSPELKRILNSLDANPAAPAMVVLVDRFDAAAYKPKPVKREYEAAAKVLDPVLARTKYIGLTVTTFTPRQLTAAVRFIGQSDADARTIAVQHLSPGVGDALPLLALLLSTPIEYRNYANPNGPATSVPTTPTGPADMTADPGMPMPMSAPTPGPGSGRFPVYYPGLPPGSAPPPGPMTGASPTAAPPFMADPPTAAPPFMADGPPGGMPPTTPNQPNAAAGGVLSHVDLRLLDQSATVSVELIWPEAAYGKTVFPRLVGLVNQVKGRATVFAGNYTWHALAKAVTQYVEKNGQFPAGTLPRTGGTAERLGLPFLPAERISFFAELLPSLGRETVRQRIDQRSAWFDGQNTFASESWVPELLVPYYPQSAWRATSTLAPDHTFGGTNYVAVAGVGLDAARFNLKNPALAKAAGISGYDWGSKVDEVADGLANTIYLLQAPPGYSRPWAAGGGATVVGLDPADPMAAFKHTRPDGKVGTYAIMGDGTVRWIPADIDPQVLLGMATRAGGEKLPDLDTVAPKVNPPGQKTELKADTAPAPKPAEAKPADPKTADPKAPAAKTENGVKTDTAPAPKEKGDAAAEKK